jgi:transcriptional regulator GlxA family with amidase domain
LVRRKFAVRHRVDAAVAYHGGDTEKYLGEVDGLRAPLPMHLAEEDEFISKAAQARVLAYIEANLGSKIDTRELADQVALSNSHFSRAFTRSFGLPPMAYVATRRVERAKLMMTSTRQQLAAIAMACGFADQSHLNRSFRRRVGVSPGIWRRTQVVV